MTYNIINGDLLKATEKYIVHQVNCQGAMNSGVAKCVRVETPLAYEMYKQVCRKHKPEELLGKIQIVKINESRNIINMFSQLNYGYGGKQYTDIQAMKKALKAINSILYDEDVAFPWMIGCVRGGGKWDEILPIICEELKDVKSIAFYKL